MLPADEARMICASDARSIIPAEARMPPPPPTPTPIPTPAATPTPAVTPTPPASGDVVYRADQSTFSPEFAHLTWVNGGPVDTRVSAAAAEIRVDAISQRMRGPATISLTLVGDANAQTALCNHSRLQLQGSAPVTEGSLAETDGVILNFDGRMTRTFDGQNCPPEREFTSQGGVGSLRFVVLPDSELNENIVAICGLSPAVTTREECGRHAIAILRAVRPS
jgi:hypothetical protein